MAREVGAETGQIDKYPESNTAGADESRFEDVDETKCGQKDQRCYGKAIAQVQDSPQRRLESLID